MAGAFVWHELMTTDLAAATAFYTSVAGWIAKDSGMPGIAYTILHAGDFPVGGAMRLPDEAKAAGARPSWTGYVGVDDVDASAAKASTLGGSIRVPPMDIPNVGRFAVIADPQGAALAIFHAASKMPTAPAMSPGTFAWNELMAGDMPTVWPFYAAMFGWTKADAIDMGPMGTYQLYAAPSSTMGGTNIGGMMTRPPAMPVAAWQFYIAVPDIDAATARATAGGGQVINGPMEVPGGAWVINGIDPQGVNFALVGPRVAK